MASLNDDDIVTRGGEELRSQGGTGGADADADDVDTDADDADADADTDDPS